MALARVYGRPRIYSNEERRCRKNLAHERWKAENWEYYVAQRKMLLSRPEYLEYRRRLRRERQLAAEIAKVFAECSDDSSSSTPVE